MNALYKPFQPTLTAAGLNSFGLSLQHSPAHQQLRGIVHSYLQITAQKPTPYPVMPDGTQAVFISPEGSFISGAQSTACDVRIPGPGEYFGIRFYPGALRYFFKLDLSEITDQFADSGYFPCRNFRELHKHIYQHRHFQERAQVCEQWLFGHFQPQCITPFDQALSLIYQAFGNIRVADLANKVGWTGRHLNRLFRLHTGLSTKAFSQTIRIQHACRQWYLNPGYGVPTALELGFFDQSHLIKDYQKHLLASPKQFFARFMSDFYNR